MPNKMRIIAIDPGYERVGVAVMEKQNGKEVLLFSECFITSRKDIHATRLGQVSKEVWKLIEEYKPQALAIETLFFSKNQKTAMQVAEARGAILSTAALAGLEIIELSPADIKIAVTGHGKSDKQQVTFMVQKIMKLNKKIKYDDEYDAIAAGITFFAMEKSLQKSVIHRK